MTCSIASSTDLTPSPDPPEQGRHRSGAVPRARYALVVVAHSRRLGSPVIAVAKVGFCGAVAERVLSTSGLVEPVEEDVTNSARTVISDLHGFRFFQPVEMSLT